VTDDQIAALRAACQATTPSSLEQQIMDPSVPKNEREHWAACEIERLRAERDALRVVFAEARDMLDWIGDSPEGEREMRQIRDEFVRCIDAALQAAAK
jgi:uncharacterized protein (UPF0147 family)